MHSAYEIVKGGKSGDVRNKIRPLHSPPCLPPCDVHPLPCLMIDSLTFVCFK